MSNLVLTATKAFGKYKDIAEREECEESLICFLKAGWKYIDPSAFISGWHLEAIAEHLQAVTDGEIKRLLINVPPRTSKSSLCSVAWPAWTWAQGKKGPLSGPHVQFLSSSYAHTLSLRDSVKTRRLITSPWYQKHWGDRFQLTGDVNTKGRFENDKGGYRLATSVDGTTTGEGGDCLAYGTLVSTPQGMKNIANIIAGDEIFAFNEQLKKVVKSTVLATKAKEIRGTYEIHTAKGHRFVCTGNHPVYSPGRGYIRASELGVGDRLLEQREGWKADGYAPSWDTDYVASITYDGDACDIFYDIQVGRFCNFFAENILVHNCILVDDANNATEVESDLVRESTNLWWDEAMSTRLNDAATGAYVVIMQRLHQEDLTGHILGMEPENWVHLMLPMEHDTQRHCVTYLNGGVFWEDPRKEENELLCPERFNINVVRDLEKRLGPFSFAGQMQQSPTPRGGAIIKDEWWQLWKEPKYPPCEFILASVDTAYTEKEENDPSALTIWGYFRHDPSVAVPDYIEKMTGIAKLQALSSFYSNIPPKIMLLYGWQERLPIHELVTRIIDTCTVDKRETNVRHRFPVDKIIIESKASGISVEQEIKRLVGFQKNFSVELYNPRKHGDKTARLYAVQHLFAEGMIYVPWIPPMGYQWANDIIDQVSIFPRGSHDDFVDTVSMALRYMRDFGYALRREEQEVDLEQEKAYRGPLLPLYPA